jgi:hypothetical protein
MKKIKKFDDGGSTGGRFVDMGESRVFVPDAPAAATMGPIPSGMGSDIGRPDVGPRQLGPMSGGVGAGIGGLNELNTNSSPPATIMPFVAGNNGPEPIRRPIGQIMPPRVPRGIGSSIGALGGLRASGMKKGGTVKKMAKGGSTSSASKRGDGCAIKGKTKGRFV